MSGRKLGHEVTTETKARISAALLGQPHSKERRTRNSMSKLGHVLSLETRGKIGSKARGRYYNHGGWRIGIDRNWIRLFGRWVNNSRAVWVQFNGPIPAGHLVHHRDLDSFNDSPDNLEAIVWGNHSSLHRQLAGELSG